MHVPVLSLLLLYTAVLQLAAVVVSAEQTDKYQLFRGPRKRMRPALGRRKNADAAEGRFVSTAFLHKLVDLKSKTTTSTTTSKPTGTPSTSTSPTSTSSWVTITGPTTIDSFSPPLTAPATIATATTAHRSHLDDLESDAAGGGDAKHIRKSAADEDEDYIPYTAFNAADFPAYGNRRGRTKLLKRQRRQRQRHQKLIKQKVLDREL